MTPFMEGFTVVGAALAIGSAASKLLRIVVELRQFNKFERELRQEYGAPSEMKCKFCGEATAALVPHWVEDCPLHPIHSATRRPR